jgi:alkylation response protein AidB-like acyl-CoA dehydrogenase
MPYIVKYGTDVQRKRWLPGMVSTELMSSIAMTEPNTGSDVSAIATTATATTDGWLLNGTKTFITGGSQSDLILVVARTSRSENRRAGLSLFVVKATSDGFARGRRLEKLGMHTQDTAELFFDNVVLPADSMLGEEGRAFDYLSGNLPQERVSIALNAQAQATAAVVATVDYVKQREVFGRPVASFQNTKFALGEAKSHLDAGQLYVDRAISDLDEGTLTGADAAGVKLFCTEMLGRVVDACLQLHGGYGYIRDFPIARLYADARVMRIYGGTSEVMKSILAKSMGL